MSFSSITAVFGGVKHPFPVSHAPEKAASLRGHLWSAHISAEAKEGMTGCYRQGYQEAFANTVRRRLFCVSVYALQGLASPSAACAYGEYAARYPPLACYVISLALST